MLLHHHGVPFVASWPQPPDRHTPTQPLSHHPPGRGVRNRKMLLSWDKMRSFTNCHPRQGRIRFLGEINLTYCQWRWNWIVRKKKTKTKILCPPHSPSSQALPHPPNPPSPLYSGPALILWDYFSLLLQKLKNRTNMCLFTLNSTQPILLPKRRKMPKKQPYSHHATPRDRNTAALTKPLLNAQILTSSFVRRSTLKMAWELKNRCSYFQIFILLPDQ